MASSTQPVVAVVNTSVEILELLLGVLADEGYAAVPAFTFEFKRGERDFRAFVAEHRPSAVLWDIAIPYVENWEYFQHEVLGSDALPERCFICSTVNRTALEMLVGPTSTIELVGRPFDLQVIVDAVQRVVADRTEG
jgi:hypothetical protein